MLGVIGPGMHLVSVGVILGPLVRLLGTGLGTQHTRFPVGEGLALVLLLADLTGALFQRAFVLVAVAGHVGALFLFVFLVGHDQKPPTISFPQEGRATRSDC